MTKEQMLVIIEAIRTGHLDYITELLNDNTDWLLTRLVDESGRELLAIHYASEYGQLKIIQLFLNRKPNLLNSTDTTRGHTPVCFAAADGHELVVEYLINLGADLTIAINAPGNDCHGYLPIHWAVKRGHDAVVQCLINHGANINMRLGKTQYHLIHIASIAGQLEVVKILLNKDPGLINIMDANDQTPVLLATSNSHAHIVKYFTSENANLANAKNRKRVHFFSQKEVRLIPTRLEFALDNNFWYEKKESVINSEQLAREVLEYATRNKISTNDAMKELYQPSQSEQYTAVYSHSDAFCQELQTMPDADASYTMV